jgi:myo-inositol-1(or 4)-monophosphatase
VTADLLALAVTVARSAGAELAQRQGNAGDVAYKTSATDPVSEADTASERLITSALLAARPDDGMLGEEGADRRGSTGLRWVVDPLDGTVNYLYGMPAWSVSIACEDQHGALIGVVYQPVTGALYSAVRGEGAICDGRSLQVNDPVPLARALLATGFAYDVPNRTRQAQRISRVLPAVRDIRRIGSAALDLCMLAAGMVDAYYEDTTSRWDWAAGALIAAEAGAIVHEWGDGIIAAGPALFDELHALLAAS